MATERTASDLKLPDWSMHDPVLHLREWGSERVHALPPPPPPPHQGEWFLGTAPQCVIRLDDPHVSKRHARLMHEDSRWGILDVGSRNGTRIDGARQAIGFLGVGAEITVGHTTLIAESARWLHLRAYVRRLLGWAPERAATVDRAMRAIRLAQVRRTVLVLRGEGDLVSLARELHRRVFPDGAPFVRCEGPAASIAGDLAPSSSLYEGLHAVRAAQGGTLCLRTDDLPSDQLAVTATLRDPRALVQLVACDSSGAAEPLIDNPVTIPRLQDRGEERVRVVAESCDDAAARFGIARPDVIADRAWILRHAAGTLADVVVAAHRLAALRARASVESAAGALGLPHQDLAAWLADKRLPFA